MVGRGALGAYNKNMPISARNKLRGKIEEILLGDVMAHVVVRVGDPIPTTGMTIKDRDELTGRLHREVAALLAPAKVRTAR